MVNIEQILDEVEKSLVKQLGNGVANPNMMRQLKDDVNEALESKKKEEKEDKKQ